MFKRTKGYILLTLLVLTGLAGRLSMDTITNQERKFLIDHLKETRNNLIKSVKGLSEEQLNFRAAPERWSIKECVQHITLAEGGLWMMTEGALKQAANPEKRGEIKVTDQELVKMVADRSMKAQAPETIRPEKASWQTTEEALDAFKEKRAALLKFAKTTTDDMRNHVTTTMLGQVDAYQLLLLLSAHTNRHTLQIEEVKSNPAFPK